MAGDRLSSTSPEFCETSVFFLSTDGCARLAGTLVIPPGGRAAPAVVLVSGTGPIDRDVTFVGHTLFRTMAHALARRGIASLRFDKRGVGESEGDFSSARAEDFLADVLGARRHLVTQEGFAAENVGLLGHSEGGMVALTAAARAHETAFCVSLAGPLLSGRDNAVRSFALLARGSLQRDSEFDRYVSELDTLFEIARSNFALCLMGAFAALALVLSGIGIYGVVSYSVASRIHEIGIRMAVGAPQSAVLTLFLVHGMKLAVAGAGIGFLVACASTRGLSGMLFGISATDPLAFAGAGLFLMVVALLACWIPARRAARVDPQVALRQE